MGVRACGRVRGGARAVGARPPPAPPAVLDHSLNVCITHTRGGRTDAAAFREALETALIDMQRLCASRNVTYLSASAKL